MDFSQITSALNSLKEEQKNTEELMQKAYQLKKELENEQSSKYTQIIANSEKYNFV